MDFLRDGANTWIARVLLAQHLGVFPALGCI
jgi:hypothetical protein